MIAAMRIASKFLVFICFPFNVLGYQANFVPDIDIYNDLVAMSTTCFPEDLCLEEREDDSPVIPPGRRCSCHAQCAVYDTCCFNSPHRGYSLPLMECTNILGFLNTYFLVGKCPFDARGDSVWKSLCEDPWNGEDDILKIAPVTSLDTRTVYKNIYCFRCHERSDNFHQWYLHMEGVTPDETAESKNYAASYDQVDGTWKAVSDDKSASVKVDLHFSSAPEKFSVEYVQICRRVVSDCHDSWTDDSIRDKCRGYSAFRFAGFKRYKNPHCAICNFEPPDDISCEPEVSGGGYGGAGGAAGGGVKLFSFRRLIGGMYSEGDIKTEKLQNKCSANHLWDPYGKKCRKIACALPGYVIRNGRCTRP